jgi:hypothetical protein
MTGLRNCLISSVVLGLAYANNRCRVIPGDASWPSIQSWDNLNRTVNGRLIPTVPIPAVCHTTYVGAAVINDTYSQSDCAIVQTEWLKDVAL